MKRLFVVAAILLIVGLAVEATAAELMLGKKISGQVSICVDKELAVSIAEVEVQDGFDAAVMLFNMARSLTGQCDNLAIEITPLHVVFEKDTKDGRKLSVVEVAVTGAQKKYYIITHTPVKKGLGV